MLKKLELILERLQLEDTRKQKKKMTLSWKPWCIQTGEKKLWFLYLNTFTAELVKAQNNVGEGIRVLQSEKARTKEILEVYCFTASKVRRSRDRSLYCNQRTFCILSKTGWSKTSSCLNARPIGLSEKPCFVSCYLIILSKLTGPATS